MLIRIIPNIEKKSLNYLFQLLNKRIINVTFHIQWDTSGHNEWFQNTDEELIDDHQKRKGIYEQVRNHDQGFLESELIEMYNTYFKSSIYVDSDDNTINIVKNDLTPYP